MKLTRLFLILVFALMGCSKKPFRDAGDGNISFAGADISINVGPGWFRIDKVTEGMCSPILAGKPGLIQVYWASSEFPTIEALITQAKSNNPGQMAEETDFHSQAGVSGRIYSVATPPSKSGEVPNRVTKIVIKTQSARIVIMDLIGPDGPLHKTTLETITRTMAYVNK